MSVTERILTKSTELFLGFGINSISTDEISAGLSISKRTFYEHFESKQHLIELIVSTEIEVAWRNIDSLQAQEYNAVLEAIKIADLSLSYNKSPNFLQDVQKSYPRIWLMHENFKQEYTEKVLMQNLRKGIDQGYYWRDLKKTIIARLWMELSQVDCQQSRGNRIILHHFIKGLLNMKGISEYQFWQ